MSLRSLVSIALLVSCLSAQAQQKHTALKSINLGEVSWTKGFWADRFAIVRDSMIPGLWKTYTDPHISHAFANFEIAAGLDTGSHAGPPFHD